MPDTNDEKLYKKAQQRAELRQVVIGAVLANVICWGMYIVNTPRGSAWPLWVTFGTVVGVLATRYGHTKQQSVEKEYEKIKNEQK